MQPHPIVYVSRISNLSDARYCAGMGADMLGFVVDPGHSDFVSHDAYQEMMGWIAGPGRVIELGRLPLADVSSTTARYAPDFLHVTSARLSEFSDSAVPLIVEVGFSEVGQVWMQVDKSIAYWMVTDVPDQVKASCFAGHPVLIARTGLEGSAATLIKHCSATGIVLQGSHESAPGLKDYDHLSQILEELNG